MREGIEFGRYWLLGRLNSGGMAEVYLAKGGGADPAAPLLAIKRLLPRLSSDQDFVSMLTDEARIASGLSHPNICRIHDHGHVGRQLFIAMEFIHGKDLRVVHRRALKRGEPIPWRFAAFIASNIAQALDYAHSKTNDRGESEHIVHRDVSPQNILISYDGVAKLIDFGIAKAHDRMAKTNVGVVKGKIAYMSPEQASGETVDGRSDLFALGVVLYQLLTDRLPFRGSSDLSTLKRIARAGYEPIATVRGDVPRRLAAVVDKVLSRDPHARYQTGGDMAADLERYLADERRDVTEATLSSYMRKLFRDDYIREMARMKKLLAFEPPRATSPGWPAIGSERPETAEDTQSRADSESTQVEPIDERAFDDQSLSLAAGYDGSESGPDCASAGDNSVAVDSGPVDAERDDAFTTMPRAGEGRPAATDERGTREMDEGEVSAILEEAGHVAAGPGDRRAREAERTVEEEGAKDSVEVTLEEPWMSSDGYGASGEDLEIDIDVDADADVTVQPVGGSAEHLAAAEDWDPGVNDSLPAGFDVDIEDQPETLAMSSPPSWARSDARGPDPDSPAPRTVLAAAPGRPRSKRRRFTEMEKAILVFVAALGVAAVIGSYWYATTMEIAIDDLQAAALAPESAIASPERRDRSP